MGVGVRSRRSRPLASFAFAGLLLGMGGPSSAWPQEPNEPELQTGSRPPEPNEPELQTGFRPPEVSEEELEAQRRWDNVPVVRVEARPKLLSAWELKNLLEFELGKLVTLEQAQASVENLLTTDRFAFVDIQREPVPGGDVLVFLLEAQPYVRTLSLPKDASVRKRRLKEWLPLRHYTRLDEELLTRTAEVLGDRFEQAGYPRPHVEVTHRALDQKGAHRLKIRLTETKLPRLAEPLHIKNRPRGLMLHERIWLWWRNRRDHLFSNPVRNQVHVQEHVDRVVGYLKGQGFVEARGEAQYGGTASKPTAVIHLEPGKRVLLTLEGGRSRHRRTLWKLFWKDGYTLSEMDLARYVQNAQSELVDLGYQGGHIELSRTETPKTTRLKAQIVGGAPTVVREIRFEGNEKLSGKQISTAMLTGVKGWFPFSRAPYVPKILEEDREAIAAFYALHGFAEAGVDPQVQVEANGDTRIVLRVTEGPHRVVGRIELSGQTAVSEAELIQLAEREGLKPGADLSKALLGRYAQAVGLRYVYLGYPDLNVKVRPLRTRGEATDLAIELEEGQLQVMGKLIASGNYKTRTRTLLRGFPSHEGEPLGPIRTSKLRERVVDLGVLDSVLVETKTEDGGKTDAIVRVQDRRSGTLDLSLLRDANTGSDTGASIGGEVSVGHENLFGRALGATLEASAQFREEDFQTIQRARLAAAVRKSSFFGYQLPTTFFADYIKDRTPPLYNETRSRAATTVSKGFLAKRFQVSTTIALEDVRITPKDPNDTTPLPGEGKILSISPRAVYEGRNNFANPTRGTLASLGITYSPSVLGGETDFIRIDADLRQYLRLGGSTTLALALRGGVLESLSDEETPVTKRFYIGGETTHRSFGTQELGPRNELGVPIGADSFVLANAELRFRLAGELYGGVFSDLGNAFGPGDSFKLRPGFGLGLRYYTIIGPLRGDVGWNPSPRTYAAPTAAQPDRMLTESDFEFHLSIGHAF